MNQRERKKSLYRRVWDGKLKGLAPIRTIVCSWAASHPLITRAWIFGSRARGTWRSDSDVDIAIEVCALPDSDPLATFMFEADKLEHSIKARLPYKVDLEWYGGPVGTPTIHAGLQHGSVLVYQRELS